MTKRSVDDVGITAMMFREIGAFWERAFAWSEERAKEDRLLDVEDDKRRLTDAQYRQADAEARLLEQIRLAKEAGLDVDDILRRIREEVR